MLEQERYEEEMQKCEVDGGNGTGVSDGLRPGLQGRGRALFKDMKRKIKWMLAAMVLVFVGYSAAQARLNLPQPTLLLLDRHSRFLAETNEQDDCGFGYWPLKSLPPRVVAATIALEDRRFWQHPGVDAAAIARAVWQNVTSGHRVSGASTLAMQVARMQNPGSRTYWRKASEALTALLLTQRYGRKTILTHYLQIVPYGNRIHGISYAARRYFDKPVGDLSWAEIAFLTALPQAPGRMNPLTPNGMEAAIERGRHALDTLYAQGAMTREEYHMAAHQLIGLQMPSYTRRPEIAMHAVLKIEKLFAQDLVRKQQQSFLIQTTLDLDLQREVSWMAQDAVRSWEKDGAGNAAVIVLEKNTGEVRAWVGSTGYFDEKHSGAIDYTQVPRSSGSTLKPFLYALALERGVITPATILDDLHRTNGVGNADDEFLGPLLPRVALANSRNVPAVELLNRTGVADTYEMFRELELHDGSVPARRFGSGLAIGGLDVTLQNLVQAYTSLAGDGVLHEMKWSVNQRCESKRVMSEDTARQITLFLSDPMARLPGFPRMGSTEYPFPVAVKTGTSYGHHDAWAVCYSARYIVGVWVGHPDYLAMNRLTGYRSAAALAQKVMLHLHEDQKDGLQNISFPPPRGFHSVRVCALTGKIARNECDRVFLEWFRPGAEPVEFCDAHFSITLDARNGHPATLETPAAFQEIRSILRLGPRYAAWARDARMPLAPAVYRIAANRSPQGLPYDFATPSPKLRITMPENGTILRRDPETPAGMATIALQVVVDPPVDQVLWYVDGTPFQVVPDPFTARWPIRSGDHVFQARIPMTDILSAPVTVNVQ